MKCSPISRLRMRTRAAALAIGFGRWTGDVFEFVFYAERLEKSFRDSSALPV